MGVAQWACNGRMVADDVSFPLFVYVLCVRVVYVFCTCCVRVVYVLSSLPSPPRSTLRVTLRSTTLCTQALEGPEEDINWLSWHPKGNVILAGSTDMLTWMWMATTGKAMRFLLFEGGAGADPLFFFVLLCCSLFFFCSSFVLLLFFFCSSFVHFSSYCNS